MIRIIESNEDFEEVLKSSSELPVLVDFSATWCGPCRASEPVLQEIAEKYNGRVRVVKVDIDKNPDVAAKYNVRSIPTFLIIRDGEVEETIVGARGKPALSKCIDELIGAK